MEKPVHEPWVEDRYFQQTKHGYLLGKLQEWKDSRSMRAMWHGRSMYDAFLLTAAAQVGQVILTLPSALAQMGYGWGIFFLVFYAILGCWTVYLLTWLYFENKIQNARENRIREDGYILQYHEVIGGVAGQYAGRFTIFFNITSLVLASIIQLIASASDLYYINSSLDKRQWMFLVGTFSLLSIFLPSFRHFRAGAVLAILTTTITAVYMTAASRTNGQILGVRHQGPKSLVKFFTGATNALFTFGGHGITIEILEAMRSPEHYKYVYPAVVFYILLLIIPSSTSVYWAYGDLLLNRSNAFAVLPHSGWRGLAIVAMVMHQTMAYIIFVFPVFLVVEKLAHVHTKQYHKRVLVRIPVVLLIWFVALAVPFFGSINSVVGAFFVSISVYLIPCLAFYWTYRDTAARRNSAVKLPLWIPNWNIIHFVNALIIIWILVVGCGFGGWASLTNFVRQVHTFGFFGKCFQCKSQES
ncbi:hypothetical protein O6H91_Y092600 [Diphasiastrum complanatum]|nr:hypothetical protein O6H91_Y092600 [Diphasiastrum complanatum]